MAEAIGVVASGIGIASFVIQIISNIQTIYNFWKSIKGAPEDIGNTIEELRVLAAILKDLPNIPNSNGTPSTPISILECLQHCRKALDDSSLIVSKLHSGILGNKRQKQWTSIKSVLGKTQMRDFIQRLERAKSTLSLALISYNVSLQQQQVNFQQQQITFQQEQIAFQKQQTDSLTLLLSTTYRNENHSSSKLKTPIFSASTNLYRNPTSHDVIKRIWVGFGWYYYRSRIRSRRPSRHEGLDPQDDDNNEIERSYFPAPWFYSRGFSFHSSCILGAWQYNLRPIRVIPKSAPVFEACRTGDLQRVLKLLKDREATIYDTDGDGYTLLHIAAYQLHPNLCELLINLGVTSGAALTGVTPLHIAARNAKRIENTRNYSHTEEDFQNTVRILIEKGQCDPMAVNHDDDSALHCYNGPLEIFLYMIKKQTYFQIDLDQENKLGLAVVICILHIATIRPNRYGLHLTRQLFETGYAENDPRLIATLVCSLYTFLQLNAWQDKAEMKDWISWLISCVPRSSWGSCTLIFVTLIGYDGKPGRGEKNKKPLIIIWLCVLLKANINLRGYLTAIEGKCANMHRLNEVPDVWYHRHGIKRILNIEYGSTPNDVSIIVRDVEVRVPEEERMPSSWCTDNSIMKFGVFQGMEPTADWCVSTRDWDHSEESLWQVMDENRLLISTD